MTAITLTTDFGARDWFVGAMKGVILGIAPQARVIDLTHDVAPGDLQAAAFALAAAAGCFPTGTIHVVVVDPGVGGERAALAIRTRRYGFVGPDNGVLSWALAREEIREIRRLEERRWFRQPLSATFHGRDVFAPVAAHLSRGVPWAGLGPRSADFLRLPWPPLRREADSLAGQVIYIDRFGNAITNLPAHVATERGAWEVAAGRRRWPLVACYAEAPAGSLAALPGSTGFLELALRDHSAAQRFGLRPGTRITLVRRRPPPRPPRP